MTLLKYLFPLCLALAVLTGSLSAQALTPDETGHLLRRTAFGPRPQEMQALLPLTRTQAVDKLLGEVRNQAVTPLPRLERPQGDLRSEAGRRARNIQFRAQSQQLKNWWLQEMLVTPTPLTETMTLFWHNHFTSGLKKVRSPAMMAIQNQLLREQAFGNFASLLQAISRDPAMLRYLDGAANRKDKPNENFARELLELFTLGEGHYSEADIKAAARAFSGWTLNAKEQAVFKRPRHDTGNKTFLGQTGPWRGEDIIRILLEQPQTARWIVTRLWLALISPDPDPKQIASWGTSFAKSGYAIKPLLRTMLLSEAFWAERGSLIKSPLELTVGSFRSLNLPPDAEGLAQISSQLGQDVFEPPNVKGWPGGPSWINSRTLVARQQFLTRLVQMQPTLAPELKTGLVALSPPTTGELNTILLDQRYQLK